ncbi:MAG: hypothetical protein QNK23_12290 [Crocinitomicaceae bacterium]|nr:hypothetical protein [Crocinitomicaceae bacterium]
MIDKILESEVKIEDNDAVSLKVVNQQRFNKAPFHNKFRSLKDGYLIFTTLQYCEINGIDEFYFISDNPSDFSFSDSEIRIHPEIIEEYQGIRVNYFTRAKDAFDILKLDLGELKTTPSIYLIGNANTDLIKVDDNAPIITQLKDYFESRFEELAYLPSDFFTKQKPFELVPSKYRTHNQFSLELGNQELYEFFKLVNSSENETGLIDHAESIEARVNAETLKEIRKVLTRNLVFYVYFDREEPITIRYGGNKDCNCLLCKLKSFKYKEAIDELVENDSSEELEDLIQNGYVWYKLGNFNRSAQVLLKAQEKVKMTQKFTLQYLIAFNLEKVRKFIYGRDQEENLLRERIGDIDLEDLERTLVNKNGSQIRKWIGQYSFTNEALAKLDACARKIKNFYYSTENGGSGSNNHHRILIFEYSKLVRFLELDNVIFDRFTEFKQTTSVFIEAVIASHAINNKHQSRIAHFDGWLLNQIIFRAEPEEFRHYVGRYKLQTIKYNGGTLIDLERRFIVHFKQLADIKRVTNKDRTFQENLIREHDRISQNLIILLGLVKFNKHSLNKIVNSIIEILPLYDSYQLGKQFEFLVIRRVKLISRVNLELFLRFNILNDPFMNSWIASTIHFELQKNNFVFTIKHGDFLIKQLSQNKNDDGFKQLCEIYPLLNTDTQKNKVTNIIQACLTSKFEDSIFYLAVLYKVIGYYEILFVKFAESNVPTMDLDLSTMRSYTDFRSAENVSFDEKRYEKIDKFINVVFSLNISLNQEYKKRISRVNRYYKWLTDMEGFDYSHFNPTWISEYQTRFYFRRMSQSSKLKSQLEKFIQSDESDYAQRELNNYLNIYIRKTWDK